MMYSKELCNVSRCIGKSVYKIPNLVITYTRSHGIITERLMVTSYRLLSRYQGMEGGREEGRYSRMMLNMVILLESSCLYRGSTCISNRLAIYNTLVPKASGKLDQPPGHILRHSLQIQVARVHQPLYSRASKDYEH